jgi:hypothetical protein
MQQRNEKRPPSHFFFLIKINRDPQNTTQITNDCATWSAQKSGSDTPGVSGTCFSSGICCANFVKTILWQVMNKESTGFWLRQRNVSLVIYLSHVTDTFHYTKLYRVHLRIESTNLNDEIWYLRVLLKTIRIRLCYRTAISTDESKYLPFLFVIMKRICTQWWSIFPPIAVL